MHKAIIIDDERLARNELKKLLSDFPEVEVIGEAANAAEGIEKIESLMPDLIFLDLNMPVMDGWGFLAEYEDICNTLAKKNKLYIVSSSISPHEMERAGNISSVSEFIIKPLVKEKFLEILDNL